MLERSRNSRIARGVAVTLVTCHGAIVMSRVARQLAPSKVDRCDLLITHSELTERKLQKTKLVPPPKFKTLQAIYRSDN